MDNKYKIAIVHDWLTGMRGGEKALESLIDLYPQADIYTLLWVKGSVSEKIEKQNITTSFLQNIPLIKNNYRKYLPLFPMAIESFDLNKYDLIISSSHCVAKGVIPAPHALHVCYCYTPMRYIWNMYFDYFGRSDGRPASLIYRLVSHYLRIWDLTANFRVDNFIAISDHIAKRIKRYYNRSATVIYPPVDTRFFHPAKERLLEEPYYLIVSALVPYKRVDLAVKAFNQNGQRLLVIGEGPEKYKLQKMSKNNISFVGWEKNERLRNWYSHCEALVFPGEEDFGIVPVEVQACGRPVVAYARGGAAETVVDRKTGVLFMSQKVEDLLEALQIHSKINYNPDEIIDNARKFSKERFHFSLISYINKMIPIK